ncbi:MAG: crossover junction endodeoxyribonuclease RuvC [Proteobacteria bacterium]|nr:crossover junction endodeoxyribonuclease RuvC [Pseudomonadota bacterium]
MIKVIGIDPGLASTGVGIICGTGLKIQRYSFGSINTSKNQALPERLNHIFSKVLSLLKDEKPDLMVLEDVFSLDAYPKSGISLGKVTGVILLSACHAGISATEVAVREVKHVLTGNGNANKQQLELTVRNLLKLNTPIRPFHASDAIALALLGLFRYNNNNR